MEQYTDEPIFTGMNLVDLNDAIKALKYYAVPDDFDETKQKYNKKTGIPSMLEVNQSMIYIMYKEPEQINGFLESFFYHVKKNSPYYPDLLAKYYTKHIEIILKDFGDKYEEYMRVKEIHVEVKTIKNMVDKWIKDYENNILFHFAGRKKLFHYVDPKYLDHISDILLEHKEHTHKFTPF